jgi:hypothetical protein
MPWAAIGIDGGLTGAVVAVSQDLRLLGYFDMPLIEGTRKKKGGKKRHVHTYDGPELHRKLGAMIDVLRKHGFTVTVFLEFAQAMPKQGVSSVFTTGRCYGMAEMALVSHKVPYQIIHSATWMKQVFAGLPKTDDKSRSFTQAARLFPLLPLKKPKGTTLSLDGRADAALLAYYGLTQLQGTDHESRAA